MSTRQIQGPPIVDPVVQRRYRTTVDLLEAAEQIMRQNLRRRHPEASSEEIEILLGRWYTAKPMPEHPAMRPGDLSRFAK